MNAHAHPFDKPYFYRVEDTDNKGKQRRHLAEVHADDDEAARRKIIHMTLAAGGWVQTIRDTQDHTRLPGEDKKKVY